MPVPSACIAGPAAKARTASRRARRSTDPSPKRVTQRSVSRVSWTALCAIVALLFLNLLAVLVLVLLASSLPFAVLLPLPLPLPPPAPVAFSTTL